MASEDLELSLPSGNPLVLLFGYLPLLLTVGVAAIAAKAVIWLFTLLVSGPIVAFLWRTRRRLADATKPFNGQRLFTDNQSREEVP
jgi:hypothetical protein